MTEFKTLKDLTQRNMGWKLPENKPIIIKYAKAGENKKMEGRITDKQAALLKKLGVSVDYKMSMEEASKLIDEILNKAKPEAEARPQRNFSSQAPMWGRYAVDLLIAMIESQNALISNGKMTLKEAAGMTEMATNAIQIVLSMRNQFKE